MPLQTKYKLLETRPGSNYRQLFVKGRKIRAEILYRATVNAEPRTPEEVACDYDVTIEAIHEAIHYCQHNEELLRQERDKDWADLQARRLDKPSPFASGTSSWNP
jgi:uncharacterized protein (DUF433 family)